MGEQETDLDCLINDRSGVHGYDTGSKGDHLATGTIGGIGGTYAYQTDITTSLRQPGCPCIGS